MVKTPLMIEVGFYIIFSEQLINFIGKKNRTGRRILNLVGGFRETVIIINQGVFFSAGNGGPGGFPMGADD